MKSELEETLKSIQDRLIQLKNKCIVEDYSTLESTMDTVNVLLDFGWDLYCEFFDLAKLYFEHGLSRDELQNGKYSALIKSIASLIIDNEPLLHRIISSYADFRIGMDEYKPVLEMDLDLRSGAQFMYDLFTGISEETDAVLNRIKEDLFENFDNKLEIVSSHEGFSVKKEEIPEWIPKDHVWWFLASEL
jgi:hypothetical protein